MQFRAEGLNVTKMRHFGNPGNNTGAVNYNPHGSTASLNGFSQITNLNRWVGSSSRGAWVSVFASVSELCLNCV
jgi:hypothetical protein